MFIAQLTTIGEQSMKASFISHCSTGLTTLLKITFTTWINQSLYTPC